MPPMKAVRVPECVATVDPRGLPDDQESYSRHLGHAGYIDNSGITTFHVTSDPERVINTLSQGTPLDKGREEGLIGDLGTSGLYASAAPQLWMNRAPAKWRFLETMTPAQHTALLEHLEEAVRKDQKTHYIAQSELDSALRDIRDAREGHNESLVGLAGQPYNIAFWEPKWLQQIGVAQEHIPIQVKMRLVGKFGDLTNCNQDRGALTKTLKTNGYDGVFVKGGFVGYPQIVTWNNRAVREFGDWKQRDTGGEAMEQCLATVLKQVTEESIPGDVLVSIHEEVVARDAYKKRAEFAARHDDETTADLFDHLAQEEEHHRQELMERYIALATEPARGEARG